MHAGIYGRDDDKEEREKENLIQFRSLRIIWRLWKGQWAGIGD
jgi:hypothetical protein